MNDQRDSSNVRLNKWLAAQLGISRRQADEIIATGRLSLEGRTAVLGQRFDPASAGSSLNLDGRPLDLSRPLTPCYLLMDKPPGVLCSRRSQGGVPTIYSLLPEKYARLKPAGRLDKDSSGLLLLTDDGDYAHQLTHPSFGKIKRYEVSLNLPLSSEDQRHISRQGIKLPDGTSRLELSRLLPDNDRVWRVSMSQGRNRQIRRTFAALGLLVTRLHRVALGPYSLDQLNGQPFKEVSKRPL